MTTERNNPTPQEIRILVAHGTALVREGIVGLLRGSGFDPAAAMESEADLVRLVIRGKPDIILLDWDFLEAPVDTVRLLAEEKNSKGAIILVGRPGSPEDVAEALQAGARGCLSLDLPAEEFVSRLRLMARGDLVVSGDLAPALSQQSEGRTLLDSNDGLSERELEVLVMVSAGATNREIAQELTITENTVKVHLRNILDKLDLRNRQQLAAYAVREGISVTEQKQETEDD